MSVLEQLVDQAGVEVEALRVRPAPPSGRTRDHDVEKRYVCSPRSRHERDILAVAVVVVARDVAVVAVDDGAGHAGERVPDRVGAAVLVGGALDLVRGGCGAEEEVGGKRASSRGHAGPLLSCLNIMTPAPRFCGLTACYGRALDARRSPAGSLSGASATSGAAAVAASWAASAASLSAFSCSADFAAAAPP